MTNNKRIGWNLDNSYATLPDYFYTTPKPTEAKNPHILFLNESIAASLGLDPEALQTDVGIQVLAGNTLPEGGMYLAQAYAGHQFGGFTNLGDGRAIMLGEQITPEKERFDIQLKGSGRTIYSRGGDGLAATGPMLREYMISEAMHALGIPTTRSLAVLKTDNPVFRENELSRGILVRVAASHLRVGTFQYAAAVEEDDALQALADYTINRHYSHLKDHSSPYLALLEEVIERQAALIAKWQLVGFIHGVMNTDNMTISGETIDYGPCAFMNTFDLNTVFSSIDVGGRYKYGNQPAMANWNLARFAETLLPLIDENKESAIKQAEDCLGKFFPLFNTFWLNGMRAKLGLFDDKKEDAKLCADLLDAMKKYDADYTDTFLALTNRTFDGAVLFHSEEFITWKNDWEQRLKMEDKSEQEVKSRMQQYNPALIPRNHLVEEALLAAVQENNYDKIEQLMDALAEPFAHNAKQAAYARVPVPSEPFQTFCGT